MQCPFCKETIADGALKCKHCGSMMNEASSSNKIQSNASSPKPDPGKFNPFALLFSTAYYAGYGKVGKAMLCAAIGFIPLTAIPVSIYMGVSANKELPIGQIPFSWGKAAGVAIFHSVLSLIVVSTLMGMQG